VDGLMVYLTPQWHHLLTFQLWVDAATQIIFSLGTRINSIWHITYNRDFLFS
jgi:SNF family Na+-dependent transporter